MFKGGISFCEYSTSFCEYFGKFVAQDFVARNFTSFRGSEVDFVPRTGVRSARISLQNFLFVARNFVAQGIRSARDDCISRVN